MKNRILKFELIRDKMIMVKLGILEPFKVAPLCPKNGISIGRPKYHVTEDQFSRVKRKESKRQQGRYCVAGAPNQNRSFTLGIRMYKLPKDPPVRGNWVRS